MIDTLDCLDLVAGLGILHLHALARSLLRFLLLTLLAVVLGGGLSLLQRLIQVLGRSVDTPSARMIEKGISRLGRTVNDVQAAIENVGNIEVAKLEPLGPITTLHSSAKTVFTSCSNATMLSGRRGKKTPSSWIR